MPTDDRKDTNDETREDANLSVEDLTVDERTAAQVKGGIGSATGGSGSGKRFDFDPFTASKGIDTATTN
jgi:hypothetical protein